MNKYIHNTPHQLVTWKPDFNEKRNGGECEWKHKIFYHIGYAAKVSLENTLTA